MNSSQNSPHLSLQIVNIYVAFYFKVTAVLSRSGSGVVTELPRLAGADSARQRLCIALWVLMMTLADASLAIGQADADILHHALVFMIQNMAVQDKIADVTLILSPHYDFVGFAQCILHP